MFLMYRTLDTSFAPYLVYPQCIEMIMPLLEPKGWSSFIDNGVFGGTQNLKAKLGGNHSLDNNLFIIVSKDKETMLRGLATSEVTFSAQGQNIYIAYNMFSNGQKKVGELKRKTFLTTVANATGSSFFYAWAANSISGYSPSGNATTKYARNYKNHSKLTQKGFALVVSKMTPMLQRSPGKGLGIQYSGSSISTKALASHISGKTVKPETRELGAGTPMIDRFGMLLSKLKSKKSITKSVQNFNQSQNRPEDIGDSELEDF